MKVRFYTACYAGYESQLEIDESRHDVSSKQKILEYILDHLDDAPVSNLEWLSDCDTEPVDINTIYIEQ